MILFQTGFIFQKNDKSHISISMSDLIFASIIKRFKTNVMKKILFILSSLVLALILSTGCGGGQTGDENAAGNNVSASDQNTSEKTPEGNPAYDPERGKGKFTQVEVGDKLDATMAANGEKAYQVKCSGCHKVTNEKLVGPGWQGVTIRNKPEWIMNFMTNTDEMLNKDPKAQAMLEICLVRMPNQNLADDEARNLLEFMRKIDGVK
jgi:mono/diheme cytochrome c family protein